MPLIEGGASDDDTMAAPAQSDSASGKAHTEYAEDDEAPASLNNDARTSERIELTEKDVCVVTLLIFPN